nr:myocyte specific enhancer factor 2a [Hymenolepis microstoma]
MDEMSSRKYGEFALFCCLIRNRHQTMGRRKIDIKKIADEKTLLVTFAKRKRGLYSKAFELGELCDCEIAVIIFTNKNCLHTYSTYNMENTVNKYGSQRDRSNHTSREDMIRLRKKKIVNTSNSNDNAASSDCGPTGDMNPSYFEKFDPNSSRPATTNSSDLFDDQGLPNNNISEHFHNGGDNFSTYRTDFNDIDDSREQPYGQPNTSIPYQIDNKSNVCPLSASMASYDDTTPNLTNTHTRGFSNIGDSREQPYGQPNTSIPYQIDNESDVCPLSTNMASHDDTTQSLTNVIDYNDHLLGGKWSKTKNNGSTSAKPPLETPDPQQVRSSPLRE